MQIDTMCVAVVRPDQMPKGLKNPLNWAVGDRLRAVGDSNHLTQTQIGQASGVPTATISRIERSLHSPRIHIVERLATALGISPAWLAFGDQAHLPFRQRYPRPAVPHDAPPVSLHPREPAGRYKSLGPRLKEARQARGLSLRALAEPAGLSYQAVLLLEAGETIPLVSNVERLAVALDVSPGWLAFGEGEGIETEESTRRGS